MNKREKVLADEEIELYKQAEMLRIDKELVSRERGNWVSINEAREARRKAEVEEGKAIAALEGKKQALAEALVQKDKDIELLRGLLTEAIKALQTVKMAA